MRKSAEKVVAEVVIVFVVAMLATMFSLSKCAFAWGERGHHLVTRVAVRLMVDTLGKAHPFAENLADKELMLAHLANVPDIVWRNAGKDVEAANAPTHYVDLEYFALKPDFASMPATPADAVQRMKDLCAKKDASYVCPDEAEKGTLTAGVAGTAPWRIKQFFGGLVGALKEAKEKGGAPGGEAGAKASYDLAFQFAGLLSHFVGDLGNPHHTTRNYNGWESGQGGIHSYFESEVISSFDLNLEQEVFKFAKRSKLQTGVFALLPAKDRKALSGDPLAVAWALSLESANRIPKLNQLDKQFALLKPSSLEKGMKIKATRREAREVAAKFKDLAVERLATAATMLAHLWSVAYDAAGKPDFKGYQSWEYPTAPAFIPLDY